MNCPEYRVSVVYASLGLWLPHLLPPLTHPGEAFYILQNSWGASWGMAGYMLMARNKQNMCGVATEALWVTVA